jgi:hypothetical protein
VWGHIYGRRGLSARDGLVWGETSTDLAAGMCTVGVVGKIKVGVRMVDGESVLLLRRVLYPEHMLVEEIIGTLLLVE